VTISLLQRRDDHLDAFAVGRAQIEQVLLGRHPGGLGRRTRRRRAEPVDELVDPSTADRGRRPHRRGVGAV